MTHFFHSPPSEIDPEIEPGCGYMQEMLNALADGSARGITRWYAERHVEGCPHCAVALTGLRRLRARLQHNGAMTSFFNSEATPVTSALRLLHPDRVAALEKEWDEIDTKEITV